MTSTFQPGALSDVTIVGSANMDLVFTVDRRPEPGETLMATSTASFPGGKGLNQAVAAARAGARTVFIGALGDDDSGRVLGAIMADAAIDSTLVREVKAPTGQALIVVDGGGENTIIVASGANSTVTALTAADRAAIAGTTVLLMQLELPIETVIEAAAAARAAGVMVMLNAAPARELPDELIHLLDCLIVNEHEVCLIGGSAELAEASAVVAGRVARVIVTLGAAGSVIFDDGVEIARVPAPKVTAVDTTGAGDTFCGAFAAALSQGHPVIAAATFATAAAALSVQVVGAVPSIPSRATIEGALVSNGARL